MSGSSSYRCVTVPCHDRLRRYAKGVFTTDLVNMEESRDSNNFPRRSPEDVILRFVSVKGNMLGTAAANIMRQIGLLIGSVGKWRIQKSDSLRFEADVDNCQRRGVWCIERLFDLVFNCTAVLRKLGRFVSPWDPCSHLQSTKAGRRHHGRNRRECSRPE
jgi:hypothetical protein